MNKTSSIFLAAAGLAVAALWARGHEDAVVAPPPPPVPVSAPAPVPFVAAPVIAVEPEPVTPAEPAEPDVQPQLDAIVELPEVDEGEKPKLDVRVDRWPVGARVYAWSMPYSVECETGESTYDPSKAVITGEVISDEQSFELGGVLGMVHGVVVGADENDALTRLKYFASAAFGPEEVDGVLFSAEGPANECDPEGC